MIPKIDFNKSKTKIFIILTNLIVSYFIGISIYNVGYNNGIKEYNSNLDKCKFALDSFFEQKYYKEMEGSHLYILLMQKIDLLIKYK